MSVLKTRWLAVILLFCLLGPVWAAKGQAQSEGQPELVDTPATSEPACNDESNCTLVYEAAFFDRYRPITALDMVRNVPGFQIDNGDGSRGFAGAAGNVLINGARPASKSASASDILERTPASNVARIELIRGKAGGLDLRGQSVAVNVILKEQLGGSTTFEVGNDTNYADPGAFPFLNLSYTDKVGGIDYTAGIEVRRRMFFTAGQELLLGPSDEILEVRNEFFRNRGYSLQGSLNAETTRGRDNFRFNGQISLREQNGGEQSLRIPAGPAPAFFLGQGDLETEFSFEAGLEWGRTISDSVSTKLIGLYRQSDENNGGTLEPGTSAQDAVATTLTDNDTVNTEIIIRTEIDYSGIEGHLIELSAEGAQNTLNSVFELFVDQGAGLSFVPVPGADTNVRERRGDFSVSDSFSVGPVIVDAIMAAETSTITQTGQFEANRSFFFLKPSLSLTYNPSTKVQVRARGLRQVGQLNFFDFVSSSDLGDNELALGNPDLDPETTWVTDLSVEWRFGSIGSVALTGYYNFISDVQDTLPIGAGLEVPGNIGSGIRRGVSAEGSLPFDWLGLKNSRLDFSTRYQDSSVTDPVTGLARSLSFEQPLRAELEFRQDFVAQRWAWGWDSQINTRQPFFGLDELNFTRRTQDLDAFLETTRLQPVKIRLDFENLLNNGSIRERNVFAGQRALSPIAFREVRTRQRGRRAVIRISGTF